MEILQKNHWNPDFSQILSKIEIFQQFFWIEIFQNFSKILTQLEIFEQFGLNLNISKFRQKSRFVKKFH